MLRAYATWKARNPEESRLMWGNLVRLPALPAQCRRRLAWMRATLPEFRSRLKHLCSLLSARHTRLLAIKRMKAAMASEPSKEKGTAAEDNVPDKMSSDDNNQQCLQLSEEEEKAELQIIETALSICLSPTLPESPSHLKKNKQNQQDGGNAFAFRGSGRERFTLFPGHEGASRRSKVINLRNRDDLETRGSRRAHRKRRAIFLGRMHTNYADTLAGLHLHPENSIETMCSLA